MLGNAFSQELIDDAVAMVKNPIYYYEHRSNQTHYVLYVNWSIFNQQIEILNALFSSNKERMENFLEPLGPSEWKGYTHIIDRKEDYVV